MRELCHVRCVGMYEGCGLRRWLLAASQERIWPLERRGLLANELFLGDRGEKHEVPELMKRGVRDVLFFPAEKESGPCKFMGK